MLLLLVLLCPSLARAHWQRNVTNYSRHDYRASSQNWGVIQQDNGWMYFANNNGLLEFDGTNWTLYPIDNAKMRSLVHAPDGRIYAGGLRQFGYFKPDALGRLRYVCLSDSLSGRRIENIWNIVADGNTIYYKGDNAFYRFKDGVLRHFSCPNLISATVWNGCFYVYAVGKGLLALQGDSLVRQSVDGAPLSLLDSRVVGMYPWQGGLMVVTDRNGLYFYKNCKWTFHKTEDDRAFQSFRLSCSAMKGDMLALGTVQDGVFLVNLSTGRVERISTYSGLQNKTVLSVAFDRDDNLWLGLDNGIDCVHLSSPVPGYCKGIGSGYVSAVYQGKLWLGTNQGVFVTEWSPDSGGNADMEPVGCLTGQIYSLSVHDNTLFCTGADGVGVVNADGSSYKVEAVRGVWRLVGTENGGRLLAAAYAGFHILQKGTDGRWRLSPQNTGSGRSAKSLCVEPGKRALWYANKEDGLVRLLLSEDGDSIIHEKCYNGGEFPKGEDIYVGVIDGTVTAASRHGLFAYNPQEDVMVRDTLLEHAADGTAVYTYFHQDSLHNIWYVANGSLKILHYDKLLNRYIRREREVYFTDALVSDYEHVNVTDAAEGKAIVGLEDGFALLNTSLMEDVPPQGLALQIRRVWLRGVKDSLVYGSSYLPMPEENLRIPYSHNSIRISYAATNYDRSLARSYSCSLEGPVREEWTQPETATEKEYIALPEGKYTFRVSTYVNYDEPVIASFSFEILPPWYRSWWCYLLYVALLCGGGCFLAYRIRLNRNRMLVEQEQLFREESEKKDKEIDTLQKEKLEAELRYKSEELIRSTLNIVRKNEMLMSIRKEVQGISHSISADNLVALRRKTLRLLGQIETNLEHDDDLQAFQSSFDSVHRDFFRQLEEAYPELTVKEKLLCAYIKMNLLSKEIAPLLNISLRGVEISRYRLRKKLNLAEGENLAEFLQKFSK